MATFSYENAYILKLRGNCVAYLRTSRRPQSKLNMAAQHDAVVAVMSGRPTRLVATFVEHEPLINGERPVLLEAVSLCKAKKATLLLGKADRMRGIRRWLDFIDGNGVQFMGADVPAINSHNLWLLRHNSKKQGLIHGQTIKAALTRAKEQGVVLGGKRANATGLRLGPRASTIARKDQAKRRAGPILSEIELLRHRGITTLTAMATRLNQMGHAAPRGGKWSPSQVRSVIKKFEK